ncbi:MFS transporter [Chlamydiales bacterium]|nr:MFS transporter [Chlamydiales bacterium]
MSTESKKRSFSPFTYLNITQFLGALNDNIYKLLIVYFLIGLEGPENSPTILSLTGAIFVIPFLLFSAASGTLADRYSKSTIIITTKILEVITMSFGLIGFFFELKMGSYLILFMMATQSAVFGPSKYGIIPEIVPNEHISKANGLMSFFTFFAIILGTFLASFMTDITNRNFVISAIFCILIAIIGLIFSCFIEYTPPAGSEKKVSPNIVSDIYRTIKRIWFEAPAPGVLLTAMGSSVYFLFIGAYMQLVLIPFAVQVLHISDVQGGYLFLCTALGIGIGSFLAGRISGKTVELGLIPLAALALGGSFFVLYSFADNWKAVIPIVVFMGMAGGMFLVPIDSYIQVASPKQLRGQVIAATNFFSFIGVLFASFTLYLLTEILQLKVDTTFIIIGIFAMIFAIMTLLQFFDFATRFIGMILSRLHFKTTIIGEENIPSSPVIYVCPHTDWNDTLLLLGAQRRRMRFFIQEEQDHSPLFKKLYRLFRSVQLPQVEPLENNQLKIKIIKKALKKGISVCIFIAHNDPEETIEQLKHSYCFDEVLDELDHPMIPVIINKEIKTPKDSSYLSRFLTQLHCPAVITFGHLTQDP